jgi:phospholipase C
MRQQPRPFLGRHAREDLPVHYLPADAFTICDNYFCPVLGATISNRLYWLSATIDPDGQFGGPYLESPVLYPRFGFSWEIMPQALERAGVSWKIYQSHQVLNGITYNGLVDAFKQSMDPGRTCGARA